MARSEYASFTEILLTGVTGVLFSAIAGLGLVQLVRGDYGITVHICLRYGLHARSTAVGLVVLGSIVGTACIWRAVDLWRFRRRRKR